MASRNRVSCGLDIEFTEDLEESIENSSRNGYDFICANVVRQGCTPFETANLCDKLGGVTDTSFLFNSQEWASLVVGKLSYFPDLTSVVTEKRICAEEAVKQELHFVAFLSLPAIIVEIKSKNCSNIARMINTFLYEGHHNVHIWVKVPLHSRNCEEDTWHWWNKFRTLCSHHSRIGLALELTADLPSQLERWQGEPIRVVYIPTSVFLMNQKGFPVLSRAHQQFVKNLMKLNCQIVLSGPNLNNAEGILVYHQYLDHLFQGAQNLGEYEKFSKGYEDHLQAPLQPLMDNLESSTYEIFERDPIKYKKYEEAVYRCLLDQIPDSAKEQQTAVIMVLGAGRGPLVRMSLRGAKRAQRKVRLYAVEKNRNAAVLLQHLCTTEWKDYDVTVVSSDMRFWNAPELADIVVSELLGSLGDNELSPECLDGANRFLKPDAVSIPQSYTSYISPISSHKLYNEIKGVMGLDKNKTPEAAFETLYVVRIHNYHELTEPVPLFTFNHPNWDLDSQNPKPEFHADVSAEVWDKKFSKKDVKDKEDMETNGKTEVNQIQDSQHNHIDPTKDNNQIKSTPTMPTNSHNTRYQQFSCTIPFDTMLHGFGGYFRCALYKDVEISIEPKTHSPGMFSWFPIFVPLMNPIPLTEGCTLQTDFWRCSNGKKVWYEWCVTSPQASQIHNPNGRSYTIGL
uniref:protein arginine N-methyltransferase 5-like n=1 Tax=Styela clava TaxID=7725 RepID=UPI00193A895F|nr:protein arginine N-methyltransferase 5-like [Styela clava]